MLRGKFKPNSPADKRKEGRICKIKGLALLLQKKEGRNEPVFPKTYDMPLNRYIRFDWAAKKILRDKENFAILEGLLTVLLAEPIHILEILESESNQYDAADKFNRVDIKARNSKEEIIIVEIQLTREIYYLERILYGVSKAITEHINLGDKYDQVKKVYSISILYFDLGKGEDFVYRGRTVFEGLTKHDTLQITAKERDVINMKSPDQVFPEYFLLRVNAFNKIAENHLEEWICYLKTGDINENTTAPGLQEAKRKLEYLSMSRKEKAAYDEHLNAQMIQNDVIAAAIIEGRAEGLEKGRAEGLKRGLAEGIEKGRAEGIEQGLEEGRAEGREEGRAEGSRKNAVETAARMKQDKLPFELISKYTGLSEEEIEAL